jgi:DNA-binding MarR family transcriptional regulator
MQPAGRSEEVVVQEIADRLHSGALRLLRRLRRLDEAMALSAPRASALSVLVFGGPTTLGRLAKAEQVTAPTMTRLVAGMERDGLVRRKDDPQDRRVVWLHPTAKGSHLLRAGRQRRVSALAADIARLSPAERATLKDAAEILERLFA